MIASKSNYINSVDDSSVVKLPYQAPQLVVLFSTDIEHNEGFASDAGLNVGAS